MKTFLKNFKRWGDALPAFRLIAWVMAFIVCGAMSFFNPVAATVGFIFTVVVLLMSVKGRGKKLFTLGLIASLLFSGQPHAKARAVECNALIIGGIAVIVGGVVIYRLVKFCKAHFPPPGSNPSPAPPTPQPTNDVPTNTLGVILISPMAMTQPEAVSYDVGAMGWMDNTVEGSPVPFQDFLELHLLASSDLNVWTNFCTVKCWLSSNSMETVTCDYAGAPVLTNWCKANPYTDAMTNRIGFPLIDPKQTKMFFRWQ